MHTIKAQITQREAEAFFDNVQEMRGMVMVRNPQEIVEALALFHRELVKQKPNTEQYRELATRFMDAYQKQSGREVSGAAHNRIYVFAAIRAGILEGVDAADVGGMKPYEVKRIAEDVAQAITGCFEVPGE